MRRVPLRVAQISEKELELLGNERIMDFENERVGVENQPSLLLKSPDRTP